jgi:hypothetical protein
MVWVAPAFVPESRAVRDRTERPQDEPGAMPPAPGYPKYACGRFAIGPPVMNPALDFVSGRIFSAPRKVDLCAPFLFATEKAPATPEVHVTTWPSWS